MNATFSTLDAPCEDCRSRHGKPIDTDFHGGVGSPGRIEMGHQMYHTHTGRTAACSIPTARTETEPHA